MQGVVLSLLSVVCENGKRQPLPTSGYAVTFPVGKTFSLQTTFVSAAAGIDKGEAGEVMFIYGGNVPRKTATVLEGPRRVDVVVPEGHPPFHFAIVGYGENDDPTGIRGSIWCLTSDALVTFPQAVLWGNGNIRFRANDKGDTPLLQDQRLELGVTFTDENGKTRHHVTWPSYIINGFRYSLTGDIEYTSKEPLDIFIQTCNKYGAIGMQRIRVVTDDDEFWRLYKLAL
jgi:hypothetical protein